MNRSIKIFLFFSFLLLLLLLLSVFFSWILNALIDLWIDRETTTTLALQSNTKYLSSTYFFFFYLTWYSDALSTLENGLFSCSFFLIHIREFRWFYSNLPQMMQWCLFIKKRKKKEKSRRERLQKGSSDLSMWLMKVPKWENQIGRWWMLDDISRHNCLNAC